MSKFICSIDLFGDSEKDILETSETRSREAVRIPGLGKAALGTEVILKGLTLEGPILLKIGQHFFFFLLEGGSTLGQELQFNPFTITTGQGDSKWHPGTLPGVRHFPPCPTGWQWPYLLLMIRLDFPC